MKPKYISPLIEQYKEAFEHCFELAFIDSHSPEAVTEKFKLLVNLSIINSDRYPTKDKENTVVASPEQFSDSTTYRTAEGERQRLKSESL